MASIVSFLHALFFVPAFSTFSKSKALHSLRRYYNAILE